MARVEHTLGGRAQSRRAGMGIWVLPVLFVVVIAVAAVVFFDLQTDFPFVDEYARQWMLKRVVTSHPLALYGTNPGLVQLAVAFPAAAAGLAPRFWRLTELPFLAVLVFYSWRLARRLGADQFWSALSAVALLCTPLMLSVATGMMNETAFMGLFAAGLWYILTWVEDGRGIAAAVVLVVLATAQRPQAAALAGGVTIGLLIARRGRGWRRADVVGAVAAWAGAFVAFRGPNLLRSAPTYGIGFAETQGLAYAVHAVVTLPIMLGLLLLPFAIALLFSNPAEKKRAGRREMLPVALAFAGIIGSIKFASLGAQILPGPYIGLWGIGQPSVPETPTDVKTSLFPVAVFLALEVLITLSYLVILVRRRRMWDWKLLGSGNLLVLMALTQFLPVPFTTASHDRYFLAVALPLVPVLAAAASKPAHQTWARAWAVAALAGSVAVYVAGEQDYIAWQIARDRTAQVAYQRYAAVDVEGGYEEDAIHVYLPASESGGVLPHKVSKPPKALIVFARPGDPRFGYEYHSLASGKMVIQPTGY